MNWECWSTPCESVTHPLTQLIHQPGLRPDRNRRKTVALYGQIPVTEFGAGWYLIVHCKGREFARRL